MAAQQSSGAPDSGAWRIVPRAINERGDVVYDVFHGPDRRAWGIKDEATARRWLNRLAPNAPIFLEPRPTPTHPTPTPESDSADDSADPDSIVPRRVWWNEA